MFHGPPGCGKTFGAGVLAGEMGLPLMTVRLDALFSRFLGATANHRRAIFTEMPRRQLLDRAIFRRFDLIVPFSLPTAAQIDAMLKLRLGAFDLPASFARAVAGTARGMSFADVARATEDAIRSMALAGRSILETATSAGAGAAGDQF